MHNKHGHENRYKLIKALRRFSSLAAWKHFRKSRSLEVWKSGGLKRRLSWDFISPDFITPFNFLTIKPFNPNALAFTMAEILISLTIIGVIAAITLPSLRANINEKAWATQRKALHSRMSQALLLMGNINGYGNYSGTYNSGNGSVTVTQDTAAETFVTDGLSKVFKINNICDFEHLKDCDFPEKYAKYQTNSKITLPKTLRELDSAVYSNQNPQNNVNTKVAIFNTVNGESVAVYYNPYCFNKDNKPTFSDANHWGGQSYYYVSPYICANFVYDLNGRKGPNTVGKDIWFMSALYADELNLIMIEPEKISAKTTGLTYAQAKTYCASLDARIATVEEGIAFYFNRENIGGINFGFLRDTKTNKSLSIYTYTGYMIPYTGIRDEEIRCILR